MYAKRWILIAMLVAGTGLSGCVAAVGAGVAIGADTLAERDGDEGLF